MGTKDPERFTYQTTQRHKPQYRDLVSFNALMHYSCEPHPWN